MRKDVIMSEIGTDKGGGTRTAGGARCNDLRPELKEGCFFDTEKKQVVFLRWESVDSR